MRFPSGLGPTLFVHNKSQGVRHWVQEMCVATATKGKVPYKLQTLRKEISGLKRNCANCTYKMTTISIQHSNSGMSNGIDFPAVCARCFHIPLCVEFTTI